MATGALQVRISVTQLPACPVCFPRLFDAGRLKTPKPRFCERHRRHPLRGPFLALALKLNGKFLS